MIVLHTVRGPVELATLQSLLEADAIATRVRSQGFGSLFPGPGIDPLAQAILVEEGDADRAREILADYLGREAVPDEEPSARDSGAFGLRPLRVRLALIALALAVAAIAILSSGCGGAARGAGDAGRDARAGQLGRAKFLVDSSRIAIGCAP